MPHRVLSRVSTRVPESLQGKCEVVQKSRSSGMSRYRSRLSGFEKAPRCSTGLPAIIRFTATSTFLPLRVYYKGGEK